METAQEERTALLTQEGRSAVHLREAGVESWQRHSCAYRFDGSASPSRMDFINSAAPKMRRRLQSLLRRPSTQPRPEDVRKAEFPTATHFQRAHREASL